VAPPIGHPSNEIAGSDTSLSFRRSVLSVRWRASHRGSFILAATAAAAADVDGDGSDDDGDKILATGRELEVVPYNGR